MPEATLYLFKSIGDFITIAMLLNFFFRLFKVDYYNPIVRGIVIIIDSPIRVLRNLLKPWFGIDIASLMFAFFLQVFCFYIVSMAGEISLPTLSILLWSFYSIVLLMLKMIFWAMLIGIILSWISPLSSHPGASLIHQLSDPVFRPFRAVLPPMGGLDFSPILAFIFVNFMQILIRNLALDSEIPIRISIGF